MSKCAPKDHAPRIVDIRLAGITIEGEGTRIRAIIVIATTVQERIRRVHEIREERFSPYNYIYINIKLKSSFLKILQKIKKTWMFEVLLKQV